MHVQATQFSCCTTLSCATLILSPCVIGHCSLHPEALPASVILKIPGVLGIHVDPQLNGKLTVSDDLWVTGVALVGALIGQVISHSC